MYSTFLVSKSECMTCNNQVLKTLGTLQGVFGAEMDRIDGRIIVNHTDEVTRQEIGAILITLGFPERKEEPSQEAETEVEADEPSIWGCAL
ncbi:MAG: hypothetical protein PHT07_01355 [Paludibacter sp.]|nr:hypothetical protein [Paludibacter sp.]